MTILEEEALNELHKEAYNDTIDMSDLAIIAEYHKCLIKVLGKRIDSLYPDLLKEPSFVTWNKVKELLK